MSRFSFRSINTLMICIIGVILVIGLSILTIYVSNSSYDIIFDVSKNSMNTIDHDLKTEIEDMIDYNMSMMHVVSANLDIQKSLLGIPNYADDYVKSLLKTYSGIISIYVCNTDGEVVTGFTTSGGSLIGMNYGDRPYFKGAISGKDFIQQEILVGKKTGLPVFVISVPVFDDSGKVIGVTAVSIDWQKYADSHILNVKIGENGYAYVLDSKGVIIAHPDKSKNMQGVGTLDFVQDALLEKQGVLEYEYEGKEKVQAFSTVERTGWLVCVSAFRSDLTSPAKNQRNTLIAVAAGLFLILLGSAIFAIRRFVIAPLRNIMAYSAEVAGGNFKAKLPGSYRYEMKELAHNFQETTAALKDRLGFADGVLAGITFPVLITDAEVLVVYTNDAMLKLIGLPGVPKDYAGQSGSQFFYGDPARKTINHKCLETGTNALGIETEITFKSGAHRYLRIDASLIHDLDGKPVGAITLVADLTEIKKQQIMIESQRDAMAEVAKNANAISDRLSTATEELSAQVEQSSKGAELQSQRVAQTATAMEQMNASVLEVARNAAGAAGTSSDAKTRAEDGDDVVKKVVGGIAKLREQALNLKTDMAALGEQAQSINQIMNVISDIADQTNLLALNAAIEAARAGEAGRGFAVVADEVRKLAEKTMNATQEVGSSIQGIQNATQRNMGHVDQTVTTIEQATELANDAGLALKEIVSLVDRAADQARSIAAAAEEQSATSEEVNRSVEEINAISAETSSAMGQSAMAVSELAAQAMELKDLMSQMIEGAGAQSLPGASSPRALSAS